MQNSTAWTLMTRHVWLESIATLVFLSAITSWLGSTDLHRQRFAAIWIVGLIAGVTLVGSGAYFSGEGVYTQSVGVQRPTTDPSFNHNSIIDPVELHLAGAGLTIALSALSIGLCWRVVPQSELTEPVNEIAAILSGAAPGMAEMTLPQRGTYAARFALITSVIALLTLIGGWWVLASGSGTAFFHVAALWQLIIDPEQNDHQWLTRRLAHVICGTLIIIVPLLLAASTHWFSVRRLLRGVIIAALILIIALQIWLGSLLLFDSNSGSITRLQPAALSQ